MSDPAFGAGCAAPSREKRTEPEARASEEAFPVLLSNSGCVMSDQANDLKFLWFIPTSGDGRHLGSSQGHRPADPEYLRQIGVAVDRLGFYGVLIPVGEYCEDGWITATHIAPFTRDLKFLLAIRPGVASPSHFARQAAAIDRVTDGRLLLNIVVGGAPKELAGDGIFLAHDERYDHAADFFNIWNGLIAGERVFYKGKYVSAEGAKLQFPTVQERIPLFFGGSSDKAIDFSTSYADKYLTWGEHPKDVAEKIARVRAAAEAKGRKVSFGIRLHFIVRETDEEAWAAADKLIEHLSDETIAAAQKRFAEESDSVGQQRIAAVHGGRREALEISPNLWAGIGLVRPGAGTALVGSPKTVAARIREYQELGIDTVVGSGYPHLEEAFNVGELLFPELGLGRRQRIEGERQAGSVETAVRPRLASVD